MLPSCFGDSSASEQQSRLLRQVDTLKIFNDSVTEVKPLEEYRVAFTLTQGCAQPPPQVHLRVVLPPDFPCRAPPVLTLEPPSLLSHPWLVHGRVEGAPGLLNFSEHSELGRVVRAVIRDIEANAKVQQQQQQQHHQEHSTDKEVRNLCLYLFLA